MALVAAFGTTITIDGTPIAGAQDISGPDDSYDWADGTNHSSPNRTEEGVPTVRRTGEVTFRVLFQDGGDAGQDALLAAHDEISTGTFSTHAFVQTYPDGSSDAYSGYVMRFGRASGVTDLLGADVTLRPTGAVTYTPAP